MASSAPIYMQRKKILTHSLSRYHCNIIPMTFFHFTAAAYWQVAIKRIENAFLYSFIYSIFSFRFVSNFFLFTVLIGATSLFFGVHVAQMQLYYHVEEIVQENKGIKRKKGPPKGWHPYSGAVDT